MNALKNRIDHQIKLLLKNIAEEEGFQNYKIEKAPGSMKGDGYIGLITAVIIKGKTDSGKEKSLHLIVKSASKSDAVRVETPLASVFDREIYMYNTIIPAFREFEKEKGLPPFASSARCYKVCMIEKSESLILENLREAGYSLHEKKIPMDHDHVSLVMTEYGHLHALSFAMNDQELERYKELTDGMYDTLSMFIEKCDFGKVFQTQCEKALNSLNPVEDTKAYTVFKKYIYEELRDYLKNLPKTADEHTVVLHGDCWTNNMMFKYEDNNNPKKPTKLCLFDLQISRLGPPVWDLSYFFYSCASKSSIDNFEHYLKIYHDSVSSHLRKLGSDPEKLYPYAVLREQWKKHSRFGLILSLLLIHIMLSEEDEVTDFTEIAESGKSVGDAFEYNLANVDVYNDRARHNILHFVNNGFI